LREARSGDRQWKRSAVTQNFAVAFPEYFAAVAPTSFTTAPDAAGTVEIDGVQY
jgi:hypothetical protein